MCYITYQGLVLFDQKRKRGSKRSETALPLQAAQAPPLVRKPGGCIRWARPKKQTDVGTRGVKEKKGERETVKSGRQ